MVHFLRRACRLAFCAATAFSCFTMGSRFVTANEPSTPDPADQAIVEAITRIPGFELAENAAVAEAMDRYLDSIVGTDAYVDLIERFDVRDRGDQLEQLMLADPESTLGTAAARRLLKTQPGRLRALLQADDPKVVLAVVQAMSRVRDRQSIELLKPLVTSTSAPRSVKRTATAALGHSLDSQRYLLSLAREGKLPEEVQFAAANALLGSADAKIRDEAAQVIKRPQAGKSEPLPPISQLVRRRGDGKAGKKVFDTVGTCANCHQVKGKGKNVGPDLSEIGSKLSREALYTAILDPSAGISHNYETYQLLTLDGVVISGLLISKTDDEVHLRTAEGIDKNVASDDVDVLAKQSISLMPENLHSNLSVQQLLDLIDYLVLLKSPDQTAFHQIAANETAKVGDQRSVESAVAGLQAAEGTEVQLFAAEPMMHSPTSIDVDAKGRVWVCEAVNYRNFRNPYNKIREEGDRILVLEDRDGDGRAETSTVFYQGRDIDSPHGVCVLGDQVIVSAGSNVFVFTDRDGDLKADEKRVLFSGIGGVQHDHGIHAFNAGPDGKLYFNFGNEGKQLCDADGKPVIDQAGNVVAEGSAAYRQGMVFRCNLDGSEVETLGWNFRNNWEVCVDSFGTMWQSDNDDDGNRAVRINYVMPYGNYGYQSEINGAGWRAARTGAIEDVSRRHWHLNDPGVVPNLLQTGAGSPTGITVYEGTLLPERFRNQVVHCDAGPNVVRAYPSTKSGAGYEASIEPLLVGVADKWFRPSDVCVGPDGSLFVADWYDPGVGGHRMGDLSRGRIFRIVPTSHRGYDVGELDLASPEGAVAALESPNLATRFLARRAVTNMGDSAKLVLLQKIRRATNERYKARLLWVLSKVDASAAVALAVSDDDVDIRCVGVRMASQFGNGLPVAKMLASDGSAQVRREAAIALRHDTSAEMPKVWASLAQAHDGQDRWYLEALGIAAEHRWSECLDAWLETVGEDWDSPAGRDIIWRARTPNAAGYLGQIIAKDVADKRLDLRYYRAFDFHDGQQKQSALRDLVSALSK